MQQKRWLSLALVALLCWFMPLWALAEGERVHVDLGLQIDAPTLMALAGDEAEALSDKALEALPEYLSTLKITIDTVADPANGLWFELGLLQGEEILGAAQVAVWENELAFSGDFFPKGWYSISFEALEAMDASLGESTIQLRELVKQIKAGESTESMTEEEQAKADALSVALAERVDEWVTENPRLLVAGEDTKGIGDHDAVVGSYSFDVRGSDLVSLNNRVIDTLLSSELFEVVIDQFVAQMQAQFEGDPEYEVTPEMAQEMFNSIIREGKRELAMAFSGMHQPIKGTAWVNQEGQVVALDATSQPGASADEILLAAQYRRQTESQDAWGGKLNFDLRLAEMDEEDTFTGEGVYTRSIVETDRVRNALDASVIVKDVSEASAASMETQIDLNLESLYPLDELQANSDVELRGGLNINIADFIKMGGTAALTIQDVTAADASENTAAANLKFDLTVFNEPLIGDKAQYNGSVLMGVSTEPIADLSANFPTKEDCVSIIEMKPEEMTAFEDGTLVAATQVAMRAMGKMPTALVELMMPLFEGAM